MVSHGAAHKNLAVLAKNIFDSWENASKNKPQQGIPWVWVIIMENCNKHPFNI